MLNDPTQSPLTIQNDKHNDLLPNLFSPDILNKTARRGRQYQKDKYPEAKIALWFTTCFANV